MGPFAKSIDNINPWKEEIDTALDGYIFYLATLKSDSHLAKNVLFASILKPFKIDEKCFLFPLKNIFCFQDI